MKERISILLVFALIGFASVAHAVSTPHTLTCPGALSENSSPDQRDTWEWNPWDEKVLRYMGLVLDRQDYLAFREASYSVLNITKGAPVIGIGRSPAPITTFLSLLKNSVVTNLAMSDFRSRPTTQQNSNPLPKEYEHKKEKFEPLTPEVTEKLFAYFDQSISTFLKNKKGTVFLVDVGESGASLYALKCYLDLYVESRGFDVNFETILLTTPFFSSNTDEMAKYFGATPHKIIIANNKYILETLKSSPWDKFAEFDEHQFQTIEKLGKSSIWDSFEQQFVNLGQGEQNPRNKYFKTAIHANMMMDPTVPIESTALPAIDPHIEGVHWDKINHVYKDKDGNIIRLATANEN